MNSSSKISDPHVLTPSSFCGAMSLLKGHNEMLYSIYLKTITARNSKLGQLTEDNK